MNRKQLIFTILFCLYLRFFYFNLANWGVINFYNACSKQGIAILEFQRALFGIIVIIYYFFFMLLTVGLFTYWFRHLRIWVYITLGFLITYLNDLPGFFSFLINKDTRFLDDFFVIDNLPLIIFSILMTFLISYLSYSVVKRSNYLEKRDKLDFTFWGFSKRFWCLIIIAFNPILGLLTKYSVLSIALSTEKDSWLASLINIFNINYRGGLSNILMSPLISFIFLALAVYAFYVALEAVKDKNASYRKVKIIGILIILPLFTIITQMVINRVAAKSGLFFIRP